MDMAGFAVGVKTLKKVRAKLGKLEMPFTPGYEEDGFLKQLEIEPGYEAVNSFMYSNYQYLYSLFI